MIYIYTDGSAKRNGSPDSDGGFGVVVVEALGDANPEAEGKIVEIYKKYLPAPTTNNRAEMFAILWALSKYGGLDEMPIVYSDSSYAVNTFTDWMWKWKKKGWVKGDGKTPENLDIIQAFDTMIGLGYRINLKKIEGHAGHKYNEMADRLANGKEI